MQIDLQPATLDDVDDIVRLRNDASAHLTSTFGKGPYSGNITDKGIRFEMKTATIYVARDEERQMVASVNLSTRKPWAIDPAYFTNCKKPLYLTGMVVAPSVQRQGIGRAVVDEVRCIAREWPAEMIRLDAFDHVGGAGEFYAKCGLREVGRVVYRGCQLVYYECGVD